jgi:Raf kinase inhibitor-like YbhB/YbcL family protein
MIHIEQEVEIRLMRLSSPAFKDNDVIPIKYTCDGLNQSPPFDLDNIPKEAKCLAIIVEDPDAPINTWVHWLVWNIPVTHHIQENTLKGKNGVNDFSRKFYCGPCPLSGTHHYLFKIYALNDLLQLPENTKKVELERAMSDKIIAFGQLTGIYSRK